jgi:hypothetical protein
MKQDGRPADLANWKRVVKAHSDPLFPADVWEQR